MTQKVPRRQRFSQSALRQQQLAFTLYIAEGMFANLVHLRRTNAFALLDSDVRVLDRAGRRCAETVNDIRSVLEEMKNDDR